MGGRAERHEKLLADLYGSRKLRASDRRGEDATSIDVVEQLRHYGVVILEFRWEEEIKQQLAAVGGRALKQYEAIRRGNDDPTRLEEEAKPEGNLGSFDTARPQLPHIDLYQHPPTYRGQEIGTMLNKQRWPHVALLGYPRVGEIRELSFYDARQAMIELHESDRSMLKRLTKPVFALTRQYVEEDPEIGEPAVFPVVSHDDVVGTKLHIGGSVISHDPEAAAALERLREEIWAAKRLTMRVHPDLLFVVAQPRVVHRGNRRRGVVGTTLLTRETWHLPNGFRK
jgi:hypothetical protein